MLDSFSKTLISFDPEVASETSADSQAPERAGNAVCPHCTYVNYCNWDSGHTGECHCSNGHYWGYGC